MNRITCITSDANVFNTQLRFDRVVSIEMFEVRAVCFCYVPQLFTKHMLYLGLHTTGKIGFSSGLICSLTSNKCLPVTFQFSPKSEAFKS